MKSLLLSAPGVLAAVYFSLRAIDIMRQGYLWQEMDWNQNGTTSIGEFFASSDIGQREVIQENRKCAKYFSDKDGLPIKIVCLERL